VAMTGAVQTYVDELNSRNDLLVLSVTWYLTYSTSPKILSHENDARIHLTPMRHAILARKTYHFAASNNYSLTRYVQA
jgi:hypothetical protein